MSIDSVNHKTILSVEPLNDVFYRNCGYHCLITALHYFGRKYQLFIGNAVPVIETIESPEGARCSNKFLEQRSPDELLREMAIKAAGYFESTDICADLIKCLSQGAPAIVHVDCFYLTEKKEFYRKSHWGHSILVCGYDQQNEIFHIVDNEAIFSTKYRKAQLSFDELKTAYAGYIGQFNPQRNHISFTTVAGDGSREPANYDSEEIRRISIAHLKAIKHDNIRHLINANFSSALAHDIVVAKRIELFKFTNIIKHEELANVVNSMIADYEHMGNVLTKMELKQTYNAALIQEKLKHIIRLEEQYNQLINIL